MKRKRMSKKKSRKNFRNGAKPHAKNMRARPMRGGFRL